MTWELSILDCKKYYNFAQSQAYQNEPKLHTGLLQCYISIILNGYLILFEMQKKKCAAMDSLVVSHMSHQPRHFSNRIEFMMRLCLFCLRPPFAWATFRVASTHAVQAYWQWIWYSTACAFDSWTAFISQRNSAC